MKHYSRLVYSLNIGNKTIKKSEKVCRREQRKNRCSSQSSMSVSWLCDEEKGGRDREVGRLSLLWTLDWRKEEEKRASDNRKASQVTEKARRRRLTRLSETREGKAGVGSNRFVPQFSNYPLIFYFEAKVYILSCQRILYWTLHTWFLFLMKGMN